MDTANHQETDGFFSIERRRFEVVFVDDTTRPKKAFRWAVPLTELQEYLGQVQSSWIEEAVKTASAQVEEAGGFEKFAVKVPPGELIPIVNEEVKV